MNKLLVISLTVIALTLGACNERVERERAARSKRIVENGIAVTITDYGIVDGCSIKWVETLAHPNFWMIKCPDSTTTTEYDTGGKFPTKTGATVKN